MNRSDGKMSVGASCRHATATHFQLKLPLDAGTKTPATPACSTNPPESSTASESKACTDTTVPVAASRKATSGITTRALQMPNMQTSLDRAPLRRPDVLGVQRLLPPVGDWPEELRVPRGWSSVRRCESVCFFLWFLNLCLTLISDCFLLHVVLLLPFTFTYV